VTNRTKTLAELGLQKKDTAPDSLARLNCKQDTRYHVTPQCLSVLATEVREVLVPAELAVVGPGPVSHWGWGYSPAEPAAMEE